MRAGLLRHRITIQVDTPTQDDYGEPIASWGTFATRWAAVEPVSGRETVMAGDQQVEASGGVRVRLRRLDGVSVKHRISWDSRLFDIESVVNDPTNARWQVLYCREVLT
jgi:SPP1 family predicted phage head-tail adaptor